MRFLMLLVFLVSSMLSWAQKEDWLPIAQKDLQIKEVPGDPGASAIQLYYADYIDDGEQKEFFYQRIKILNDSGNRYADVEIVIPPDSSISGLKARTILPDGKIIEFTGKPFQKVISRERGNKIVARAFTMPGVTVNSIIEYKYTVNLPAIYQSNSWTIQHDLYTLKESFRMKPYTGPLEGFEHGYQVAALSSHMPGNIKPKQKGNGYELDVENMPAFEAEGLMPPQEDYKPQVRFFYGGREIATSEKFWEDAGRGWYADAETFIGSHAEIAREASQVVGTETDSMQRLHKLYARAQQVRNLTYERERTEAEQKKEALKVNKSVDDVLLRGYGDSEDIARFFVALARAAGFEASILRASNRKEKFFDKALLYKGQFDSEIALVNVGGKDIFLDPGTRFCPFGFVRWMRTSTLALKLDKKGGSFIRVPSFGYDQATTRRTADLTLNEQGSLQGTISVTFDGGEALERRLDALATDEAGRKDELEQEVKEWLPPASSANLMSTGGWLSAQKPLVAKFTVEIPSYASVAGTRVLMPACAFQSRQMDIFKHAERKFPVYFPYAFSEEDTIAIQVPSGYSLENIPLQQAIDISYAAYQNETSFAGRQLTMQRILHVNGIFFRQEIYPEIKGFFNKVQAGDEQQTVFHGGGTNAQNSN